MSPSKPGSAALIAGCAAIFWPGSFVFGFPGAMSSHWQGLFEVGQAEVGQTLFFVLLAVGSGMFVVGRWMERFGARAMVIAGGLLCGPTMIMAGLIGHIYLLYVWAFLIGAVSCFIYLPSITVVQLWFPEKKRPGLWRVQYRLRHLGSDYGTLVRNDDEMDRLPGHDCSFWNHRPGDHSGDGPLSGPRRKRKARILAGPTTTADR